MVMVGSGLAAGSHVSKDRRRCARELPRELHELSHPRSLSSLPPGALTSILEVLRRPASSGDRLPAQLGLRFGYTGVWVGYVRLLASGPDATSYFLVPGVDALRLPSACLRELSASKLRRYLKESREQRAGSVKIDAYSQTGGSLSAAYTPSEIQAGKAILVVPEAPTHGEVSGLVPDGVASVTLTAPDGTSQTVPVTSNLFLAPVSDTGSTIVGENIGQLKPPPVPRSTTVQWHSASGAVIRTFTIPTRTLTAPLQAAAPIALSLPVPPAVEQAGGRQLAEFELGSTVVAQSGCLACHRIGDAGNNGPGQPLTHIGSTLTEAQIEHALITPQAPMPSFKNLPTAKFKAVVEFLSLLH
jgi:Cytochrome c